MKIKIKKQTLCAHDEYETVKYPREWLHIKPALNPGDILEVSYKWNNLYGQYYRCKLPQNIDPKKYTYPYYDVEVDLAEIIES